jgi:hypothetical protein
VPKNPTYTFYVIWNTVRDFNPKGTRNFQRTEAPPFETNLNMSFLNQYMIILGPKNTHKSQFMSDHHYYNN